MARPYGGRPTCESCNSIDARASANCEQAGRKGPCTVGAPIRARKRDSAHVPYREADCFALRHSYGGSGKRRRARKYAKQLPGVNRVSLVQAFRDGLGLTGFTEGRNVSIEYRWAEGQYDRLPAMAADLVARKVSVLAATGGIPAALAAKAATTTIPIVFLMGTDPIKAGVVTSLNRPEGNVTGVSFLVNSLGTKRVELLSQLVPRASTIGMLANPTNPDAEIETRDAQVAAQTLGRKLLVVTASTDSDLEIAFNTLVEQGAGALAVVGDPFFVARRDQLIMLAARHRMPAIYIIREYPAAGGLMSYGTSFSDTFRQAGVYVGSILKGAKPADLPVIQSTKFEFVLNLKTAKALGLEVPPNLLAIADEVIE